MAFAQSLRRGLVLTRYALTPTSLLRTTPTALELSGRYRWLHVSRGWQAANAELEAAIQRVTQLQKDPGDEAKLKLYALYKQASVGPCTKEKPEMFDMVGRAKWEAWSQLGDMAHSMAAQQYCGVVDKLIAAEGGTASPDSAASVTAHQEIVVTDEGGVRTILLNRPHKYNALNYQMYREIQEALKVAGEDDRVVVTLLTGAGDYYCSGNDLSNFTQIPPEGPQKLAAEAKQILKEFVNTFIHFPKPLVAGVNGPAVGLSVTLLGLCDLVYSADHATFHAPFMSLGLSPEGCSSLLFPRFMGPARANEILMAGVKLSATEAYDRGLITRVFPREEFQAKLKETVQYIANLPPQSLQKTKSLVRSHHLKQLEAVNDEECEVLEKRWLSDECAAAIISFMQRKKK